MIRRSTFRNGYLCWLQTIRANTHPRPELAHLIEEAGPEAASQRKRLLLGGRRNRCFLDEMMPRQVRRRRRGGCRICSASFGRLAGQQFVELVAHLVVED